MKACVGGLSELDAPGTGMSEYAWSSPPSRHPQEANSPTRSSQQMLSLNTERMLPVLAL